MSYGERYSRELLNIMFNEEFIICRPDWLKNPKSNRSLELDMYCENLNLAFEYQGEQHYKFIERFHRTIETFHEYQKRDKFKVYKCKEQGIKLLHIPFNIRLKKLQTFIIELCEKNNIAIPNKTEIDINKLNIYSNSQIIQLNKIQEAAKLKGGKCLNDKYIPNSPMKFKCHEGHIWETYPSNVVIKGSWCNECQINSLRGYTISDINKIIQEFSCLCISDEYINGIQKLNFKCNMCDTIWVCSLGSIFRKKKKGYICTNCHRSDKQNHMLESIIEIAKNYNCICLSTQYKNARTLLEWKCNNCNHEWQCSQVNMLLRLSNKRKKQKYLCLNCKKN